MTAQPARIRLVGLPGAGKTTLALRLARLRGLPVLDVDSVIRLPGGRVATAAQYAAACTDFLASSPEGWVVDGDDVDQVALRYADADLVVWLDVSRLRCVARVVRRGAVDLLTDTRAWHGGRERWSLLVGRGPTADLARWTWREHAARSRGYAAQAAADPQRWVRLGHRDVPAWLASGPTARPRRVRVVGSAGAGKTTLARDLAPRLGVAHLELDSIYHLPGWQPASEQQVTDALAAFVAGPGQAGWVVDGTYSSQPAVRGLTPDLVIWVDPPRVVQLARLARRTVTRALRRHELWNGNREDPRSWLRREPERNILLWGWVMQPRQRARLAEQRATSAVPWLRVRTARAARTTVRAL